MINKLIIFSTTIILMQTSPLFADATKVFNNNQKAVVKIIAYGKKGIGEGTGFVLRKDGLIATNYHVIKGAKIIKLQTNNKVLRVKKIIYFDKGADFALLQVKANNLHPVEIGDSKKCSLGDRVFVIGNPCGMDNSISDGIISGLRRFSGTGEVLQITAPVSPGSSGSPVFNKDGKVIGVVRGSLNNLNRDAQMINIAIPINEISDVLSYLNASGNKKDKLWVTFKNVQWVYIIIPVILSILLYMFICRRRNSVSGGL
jgi:serine protease Do